MLRSTVTKFPLDGSIVEQSGLPWGALITPVSSPPPSPTAAGGDLEPTRTPDTEPVQSICAARIVAEIPRCGECGGYIAEQCRLNLRFWRCALCHARNALPERYAPAVLNAHPAPHEVAPEISSPLYEVPVDDPEAADLVTPTAYVFLVDISGDIDFLDAVRVSLKSALDTLAGDALVGIILYGKHVSFLDVRQTPVLRRFHPDDPHPSPVDVFPPSLWLRSLADPAVIARIITGLEEICPSEPTDEPARALGPAVDRALDAIEAAGLLASRLVVLAAGPPTLGAGALSTSSSPDTEPTETNVPSDKNRLPAPSTPFYADLGERAAALGTLCDVYIVCAGQAHLATLASLAQMSGGRMLRYVSAGAHLARDLWQHLNESAVVRGLMRLRTSPEYSVTDAYGCGVYRDVEVRDVYRLSAHGEHSTMAVEFAHSAPSGFSGLRGRAPALQLAFRAVRIEPGIRPRRVLRVETRSYNVSAAPLGVRAGVDPHAALALLFHRSLAAADEHGLSEARMLLFDWLAALLAKTVAQRRAGGRRADVDADAIVNVLEDVPALRSVPRLVFGLTRSALFRTENVEHDHRALERCKWEDLRAEWLATAAYPKLIGFVNLNLKSEGELPLSMKDVRESGCPVFLLDAFSTVVVYYLADSRIDVPFPPPEDCAVMRIQRACLRNRPLTPHVVVCRQGSKDEHWFKDLLVEDAGSGHPAQSFKAFMSSVADAASDVVEQALHQS